ncbi:2'-5' RNA ligase superfamily protein [Pontibacter chinhatensis]|uniref:2'-5' RNA ligase superfamily protein n=2 Tax=Pontibacter chinhatensis TaxID=1436961 RepID=A0A1I2M0D8_9BACT|nr:2'-5' RNA ligase superfamily protein [Pontibacter chinhatensis]
MGSNVSYSAKERGENLSEPLILTLQLDAESSLFFNKQRRLYFPKERNFLEAHLTLFHHLPPQHREEIEQEITALCQKQESILLQVAEVRLIGRGVAYKLESEVLQRLHRHLQLKWQPWLTPQDRQKLWPHVTVQNKVTPAQAKELHQHLSATFAPFTATGVGLQLWAYQGGPWQWLGSYPFQQSDL